MAKGPLLAEIPYRQIVWKLTASAAVIAIAAACSPIGGKKSARKHLAAPVVAPKPPRQALKPNNPLHVATAYWAGQYQKKPNDPDAALNYARNLKAMGSKDRALAVLKRAHAQYPSNPDMASEYGRLVLETGQVQLALRILKKAVKPGGKTDWRVLSAQGTAYAKLGKHAEAQKYFTAALRKNPNSPNVNNNLALSYAMSGSADKAETLLRQTIASGNDTPRLRQNLALVLGLQHKFKEAQQVASVDLAQDKAAQNMTFLRSMVRGQAVAQATPPQLASGTKAKPPARMAGAAANPQLAAAQPPAPLRRPPASQKTAQAPQLSSHSLPLPWRTRSRKAPAAAPTRIASTRTVPLPEPKPDRPAGDTKPTPPAATPLPQRKSAERIASAAAARKPRMQTVAALTAKPKPKVSAWRARVTPERVERTERKASRSLLYPELD